MPFGPHGVPSRIPSSAATNNATVAKASYGGLHVVTGYNNNAAIRYLKFFDKATAPVPGTDTPFLTITLPPTTAFGLNFDGLKFMNGIGYALVTGAGDADNTAVGAGDILGLNVCYE